MSLRGAGTTFALWERQLELQGVNHVERSSTRRNIGRNCTCYGPAWTAVQRLRNDAAHSVGGEDAGGLSNAPIHLADLGSQQAATVVNLGLAVNEAVLRQEIDEALLRLDEGTFGVCEECRNAIASERLEAIPHSRICSRCAERSQS